MAIRTIAILSPGDMGTGFGRDLGKRGRDVITCLTGRGAATRARALEAGFRDVPDLDALVAEAEVILSIMPPESAHAVARNVADAMQRTGATPVYADCNAISPDTTREIEKTITASGADYIDGGIIGHPPGKSDMPVRLYVSGPRSALLTEIDGGNIDVRDCGPGIGDASAVKMCYASVTKGTNTLHTAALITAERLGVGELVRDEFEYSSPAAYQRMNAMVPRLPVDAARWIGEMVEIAHTYESVGVTPNFHRGAREIYDLLAATPIADETRDTIDASRTLEQVLRIYVDQLIRREAAE
jgi:3-hydroxyisobutyrate dehydrogenase-like beta-hydroxyacid dehydrogenase